MAVSTKTLKFMSAAVDQINRSIQHPNKQKCSYSDYIITLKAST